MIKEIFYSDLYESKWLDNGQFPHHVVSYCEECRSQETHILRYELPGKAYYECMGCYEREFEKEINVTQETATHG